MSSLLSLIKSIDVGVYYFFNRWAGNPFLDFIETQQETNEVFKGGVFLAAYWYFWLRAGSDQEKRRRAILAIFGGTLLAIAVSIALTAIVPFRTRPIYAADLVHRVRARPGHEFLTSFPSDTAAYFTAMAMGLMYLARRNSVRFLIVLYTALWVWVPRLYLGLHYASDVAAGIAIGVVGVWATMHTDWENSRLYSPVLRFAQSRPELFYPVAFLVTFELARVFYDLRVLRTQLHALGHHGSTLLGMLVVAMGVGLAAWLLTWRRWKLRSQAPG